MEGLGMLRLARQLTFPSFSGGGNLLNVQRTVKQLIASGEATSDGGSGGRHHLSIVQQNAGVFIFL